MTPRKFFVGRAIGFGILLILGLVFFVYKAYFSHSVPTDVSSVPTNENVENSLPPVFVWKFEEASTLNLDGLPETNVFLEATYSNKKVERKLIDTTAGGCNDLPDSDEDSVQSSNDMQCYSAGLGYRFKITKGDTSYLVKRKTFEEGLPNYTPPAYEYEVVAEFPFYSK